VSDVYKPLDTFFLLFYFLCVILFMCKFICSCICEIFIYVEEIKNQSIQ